MGVNRWGTGVETHKLPGFYNLITHRNKDICWVARHLMEDLENCKRTCRPKVNGGSKSRDKWTIREYFLKETLVLSQQISEPFAKVLRLFFKSLDCLDDVLTPHCRHSGIFIDEWQVCVLLVFPSTTFDKKKNFCNTNLDIHILIETEL